MIDESDIKIKTYLSNGKLVRQTQFRQYCDSCSCLRPYQTKSLAIKTPLCKNCSAKIAHLNVSSETRTKIAIANKGKAAWNKGKSASLESRKKMSEARVGKSPANKGQVVSESTRKKISCSLRNLVPSAFNGFKNTRYKRDLNYRLACVLRARTTSAIRNKQKSGSAVDDLGCSISELKVYLEAKFQPGMTWENWALKGWHIDHIRPLASFDLETEEQFKEACHYTNLQPLWALENIIKGATYGR